MSDRGKKVLDIKWEHEGVEIVIPVKAFTKYDDKTGRDGMIFRASFKDAGIEESSSDINVIKQAIEKKLREWYSVDWTLHLLVTIDGEGRGHKGASFNVKFETEFYACGKDVRGEMRCMRVPRPDKIGNPEHVNVGRWAGESPRSGLPETGKKIRGRYGYDGAGGVTRALVKATPENVKAADDFVKAMERLLENMHDYFAPDKIELTLANAGQLLLPAPKAAK